MIIFRNYSGGRSTAQACTCMQSYHPMTLYALSQLHLISRHGYYKIVTYTVNSLLHDRLSKHVL